MKNKKLSAMLKDEHEAPFLYRKLADTLPVKYRKVIDGIIRQEKSHHKKLLKIKNKLK